MKILILNTILFTADDNIIPKMKSIKDTMIYNMCLGFKSLGHEVTLAAAKEYMPTEQEVYDFEVLFFTSQYTRLFPPSVLPYSSELKRYLKENNKYFDLVISSEVFSFNSLMAAQICSDKTIIWQELTMHQNKFHQIPSKIWHRFVAKIFMNKVLSVVPRSEKAYSFISTYIRRTSSIIVDHGININKFKLSDKKSKQLISSSQLIHRKNIDGIIYKFAALHKMRNYSDVKLIIAGRGEEEKNLKDLVKNLKLDSVVDFVGFLSQADLNEYIRKSYCFLVNTRKDLNMVSIPESIVSGTPILTNLQPSSASYIQKYHLGIAKKEWDENDIKEIIDNNSLYVKNCIAYRDKLTNVHSAQMLIDIFKSAQK